MADRRQPGAIRWGKTRIPRVRAGLLCALAAVLAVAPNHAVAQDASPRQDSSPQQNIAPQQQVSPDSGLSTPSMATTWGGAPAFLAPAPTGVPTFLLPAGVDVTAGHNAGSLAGPGPPLFLLDGFVDLAGAYTTNAQAESTGQSSFLSGPDFFTRDTVGLGAHYHGPRLTADFNYALTDYYYSHFTSLNQLQNQLNFASTAQLVPNHLSFNLNAFATPATLSRVGPISATQVLPSNANSSSFFGYTAEPVLQTRLGGYATSQTSLTESQLFTSQSSSPFSFSQSSPANTGPFAPPPNSTVTSAVEHMASTQFFGRFAWELNGSYINTQQTGQSVQQKQATADLSYALDRWVAVLSTIGYSQLTSSVPLTQGVSGPIALGGVHLSYGPTFSLIAKAGTQNNFPTYQGSLKWAMNPRFDIVGSLTDAVTTTPSQILSNLSTLAVAPGGGFFNTQTICQLIPGQPQSPQLPIVSPVPQLCLPLNNAINRTQNAQLSFIHHDQRTTYTLSFFRTAQDQLSVTPETIQANTWIYGASYNVTRQLRHNLSGYAGVSYSVASEFGGQDRIVTATAGLNYNLAKHLDTYLTVSYLQRQSTGQTIPTVLFVPNGTNVPFVTSGNLTDLMTMIGIRRTFGH